MIVLFYRARYKVVMTGLPANPTAKRTNDPVGVRNRLIDAAAQTFHAHGFGATSMHDVRRAAGASGGTLYHHFPTKKALALAVISERVSVEVASTWIETVRTSKTAASGILAVFVTVIAQLDRNAAVSGCPLGNLAVELSLSDPDIREALAREYEAWRRAIADKLLAEHAEGTSFLQASQIDAFSYVVVAMFSGAMAIAKAEQRTVALQACADQLALLMHEDSAAELRSMGR